MFSLTLIHGAMGFHTAVPMSTIHGADLPNGLCHCLCPFSGPSLSYFIENRVGNVFTHKPFSDHVPFSLSLQHLVLPCAILSYQYNCISSLIVITWTCPHSALQVHQAKWSTRSEGLSRCLPLLSLLPHERLLRSMWTERLFCNNKCPITPEQRTSQNVGSYIDTLGTVLRHVLRIRSLNFSIFQDDNKETKIIPGCSRQPMLLCRMAAAAAICTQLQFTFNGLRNEQVHYNALVQPELTFGTASTCSYHAGILSPVIPEMGWNMMCSQRSLF